jgi:hypothetical protein
MTYSVPPSPSSQSAGGLLHKRLSLTPYFLTVTLSSHVANNTNALTVVHNINNNFFII